jgi:hypothetical protein
MSSVGENVNTGIASISNSTENHFLVEEWAYEQNSEWNYFDEGVKFRDLLDQTAVRLFYM